jgi:AcrR family transcriptional regulator
LYNIQTAKEVKPVPSRPTIRQIDHADDPPGAADPDRRSAIVRALHRCVRERGYARTSLTDIAVRAGMSPSHIRYYFDGKDAILRHYFEALCVDLLAEIKKIEMTSPEQWLHDLSRFYVGNPRISQAGLSVIVEIFGFAMHDIAMKEIKTRFDEEMHALWRGFFEQAGCADGLTPDIAATLVRAMDIGLKYGSAFCETESGRLEGIFIAGVNCILPRPRMRQA